MARQDISTIQSLLQRVKCSQENFIELYTLLSNVYTKTEVNTILSAYYTQTQIDNMLANYYTTTQTDNLLNAKQNTLSWDATPTNGSTNPVTSDGIYDAIKVVADIASGKTACFVCSDSTNPSLNSSSDTITITSNLTDVSGNTITLANLKLGDIILITETDVPDRWLGNISGSSYVFYKMETTKVDLTPYALISSLSNVATSGSYNDLSDTPTIGNATLTIQKNGTDVSTFTSNATSNVTCNIVVPTNTSTTYKLPSGLRWFVGSDTASTNGWYKFLGVDLPQYHDFNITLSVNSDYDQNYYGIIKIHLRNNTTGVPSTHSQLLWMVRQGFASGSIICVTSTQHADYYIKNNVAQYSGINFTVISESSRRDGTTYTTYNELQSTEPTATYTSSDGGIVNYANSAGAVDWSDVSNQPTIGNATLTIQKSGSDIGTFTANATSNTTINVDVSDKLNTTELQSTSYPTTTPYTYRSTPYSTLNSNLRIDKLVGGSIGYNQLFNTSDVTNGGNVTVSTSNGTVTLSVVDTSESGNRYYSTNGNLSFISGHHYLAKADVKANTSDSVYLKLLDSSWAETHRYTDTATTSWSECSTIFTFSASYSSARMIIAFDDTSITTLYIKNVMLIDLTQMFGSTIASYIQSTGGVSWFKKYFPLSYYPYSSGTLLSSKPTKRVALGLNLWDEEWELGGIDPSTGADSSSSVLIRSTNYIDVLPNTTYYFLFNSDTTNRVFYYDSNYTYISYSQLSSGTKTTPSNCHYIRFRLGSTYGTTYNHDIMISLGSTAQTYEPYENHTYALPNTTLRGIPTLSGSELVFDGDYQYANGSVKRRYGVVDLGSLTWTYQSTSQYFYSTSLARAYSSSLHEFCALYENVGDKSAAEMATANNMIIAPNNNSVQIKVKNTSYTDATTFASAMSGIYLVYELATPTTETTDTFDLNQIAVYGSTESITNYGYDESSVSSVNLPLEIDGEYTSDLVDKLKALQENNVDGDYVVRQEGSRQRLVKSETLLWENLNPSSSFASQTITTSDMSGYKYIVVEYKAGTSFVGSQFAKFRYAIGECGSLTYITSAYMGRKVVIASVTSITFSSASNNGSGSNDKCIPVAVYGTNIL